MLGVGQPGELDLPPDHDRGHHVTEHGGLTNAGWSVDGGQAGLAAAVVTRMMLLTANC
jgi:hypothetical protein